MAYVSSGPVSTLPGYSDTPPPGTMCDDHPAMPAVARIQGETDSFGAEYLDLCKACADELREEMRKPRQGKCEWCGDYAEDLRARRDWEEGTHGRVYDVCGACVLREYETLDEYQDQ